MFCNRLYLRILGGTAETLYTPALADCPCPCPMRVQLVEAGAEVAFTFDGIATIDRFGLVRRELHRHATRHAGALKVPNGCSAEIAWNHRWATAGRARGRNTPGL
jgi:hypothetical protein